MKRLALLLFVLSIPFLMGQASGPTTRTPRLTVNPGPTIVQNLTVNGTTTLAGVLTSFDSVVTTSLISPDGGNLIVNGGLPLPLTTGIGNPLEIIGGQGGSTSGPAGAVIIAGGGSTNGDGGDIIAEASDGVGTNRNGGNFTLASGLPTGTGIAGLVRIRNGTTELFHFNAAGAVLIAGTSAGTAGQVFRSGGSAAITSWIDISFSATSASLGGGALAAGACASNATTVTGAATTMVAMASPNTYPGDGNVWSAQVTAANTVTTRICAIVAATPTASTYNIRVLR